MEQTIGVPLTVTPEAPTGEQNAPGWTIWEPPESSSLPPDPPVSSEESRDCDESEDSVSDRGRLRGAGGGSLLRIVGFGAGWSGIAARRTVLWVGQVDSTRTIAACSAAVTHSP